jgi:hypothetical protein
LNVNVVLQGILAALDLSIRIAESRGYDREELEQYIEARRALREEIVKEANERGLDAAVDHLADLAAQPVPVTLVPADELADSAYRNAVDRAAEAAAEDPIEYPETSDEAGADEHQG